MSPRLRSRAIAFYHHGVSTILFLFVSYLALGALALFVVKRADR